VPDVAATPQGVPFFGAIVAHAAVHGRHDLQMYVNCDILFGHDLPDAVRLMRWPRFLMVGQRINLPEGEPQQIERVAEDEWLRGLVRDGRASLHPPDGSDYFLFPRGMWNGLPALVIGRGAYDNALIAWCLLNGIPVVDASLAVTALHQFHDYAHANGGRREIFLGQDAESNLPLCRRLGMIPTAEDAGWMCQPDRLVRNYGRGDWMRGCLDRSLRWLPGGGARRAAVRAWGLAKRCRMTVARQVTMDDVTAAEKT